jgi:hypothetical protein
MIRLLIAAALGGTVGCAELAARHRDKPVGAILLPSGMLYVLVNAATAVIALITLEATGLNLGLPPNTPPMDRHLAEVLAASIGSAMLFRASFTLAPGRGQGLGPILLLRSMLNTVDTALERKRALSRLSNNDLAGLSFARDHAALAELCCHALRRFELPEAQRLGELTADLWAREDLTDADKLDCFGLELYLLVGERTLRTAADRLRERLRLEEQRRPVESDEVEVVEEAGRPLLGPRTEQVPERLRGGGRPGGHSEEDFRESLVGSAGVGGPKESTVVSGRLSRRSFRSS